MVGQANQSGARGQSVFLHAGTGNYGFENEGYSPEMSAQGDGLAQDDFHKSKFALQAWKASTAKSAVTSTKQLGTVPDAEPGNREEQVRLLRSAILKSRATVASRWRGNASVPGAVTGSAANSEAGHLSEPSDASEEGSPALDREQLEPDAEMDNQELRISSSRKSRVFDSEERDEPSSSAVRASGRPAQSARVPVAEETPASPVRTTPKKGGWIAKGQAKRAQMAAAKTTPQQPLVLKVTRRKAIPAAAKRAVLKRVAFPNQPKKSPPPVVEEEKNEPEPETISLKRSDTWGLLTQEISPFRTPSFLHGFSSESVGNADELNLTGSNIFPFFSGSVSSSGNSVSADPPRAVRDSCAGSAYMYQSLPAGARLPVSSSVSPFSSSASGSFRSASGFVKPPKERQDGQMLEGDAEEVEESDDAESVEGADDAADAESVEEAGDAEELQAESAVESLDDGEEVPFSSAAEYSGNLRLPSVLAESPECSASTRVGSLGEEGASRKPSAQRRARAPKKQPKKKKREPLPVDGSVEPFVEELAAVEDFDRETMLDDAFELDADDKGLSPAVERLRQERIALARWVCRLKGTGTAMQRKGMRLEKYLKPHQGPVDLDVRLAGNYPPVAFEPQLTHPLDARGAHMEELLLNDAQMPSTKVWQLEQSNRQRLKHLAQQRKHISILQRALRKSQREAREAERRFRGDDESTSSSDSGAPSPRAAERLILQEQCENLVERIRAETAHRESYQRAWFLEQRQKQRVAEKYSVLQRRLKAAHTVTRMEQAKQEEKQENIDDLKERLGKRLETLRCVTNTSEQYEYELVKLQRRYETLVSYLRESQEKASSYEEGLREVRSSLEHETALLQIEKNKTLNLGERLRERDNAIERMKMELRLEQDKVLSREQTIQELRDSLNENAQLLMQARDELVAEQEKLDEERRRHDQTLVQAKNLQSDLRDSQQNVETLLKAKAVAEEQEAALRHLHENFLLLLESSQKQSDVLEETVDAVADRKHKATQLLQRALDEIRSGINQKSKEEEQMKAELAAANERLNGAVEELQAERASQAESMNRAQDKYMEDHASYQKIFGELRDEIDEQKARIQSLTADLEKATRHEKQLEELTEKMKAKNTALEKRVVSSFQARGRSGKGSIVRLIKHLQQGTIMERANVNKKKVSKNLIKLTKDMQIVWTKESGDKLPGFKQQKTIRLQHIVGIDFGTDSAACRSRMATTSKKQQEILPWRCFEVRTLSKAYLFTAPSDDIAAAWVICLGRLVAQWSDAPNIKTHREVCVRRAKMKLQRYCQKNRISPRTMWLDAIAKTCGQPVSSQQRARRGAGEKKAK
uniref:PH domain-containing protein n=2 Tax=Neospora caninum (strain Liverpool) TaxID=572307 RepID=A0A0F7U3T8_NEOCL|nr:TPA: hypothetical protein BN1204_003020 [Neospora caninum Liverpool]